ncbi:guanine nucleotide-binding protein-like 3 homolog [Harpegnathos saltator]|uniref:guanine nucleotide-binding protein-like 3 homolog n=1 Tax=Harpegnathos saltator TaxID=610380 RepID=UPI000DBEEFE0|nr:guanine nucleotide-binding protein-like 3 homolog [Harpegnathos saltator]
MAKFCLNKQGKRTSARKEYKIEKKVHEHNCNMKKEAKRHKSGRSSQICKRKQKIDISFE